MFEGDTGRKNLAVQTWWHLCSRRWQYTALDLQYLQYITMRSCLIDSMERPVISKCSAVSISSDSILTVSMPMSNSLSRHVDGHFWLKLIPLLCRQLHIQSARQTNFTPRTASKWRGTAETSLCLGFLSSFTPNCNLISVVDNTHIYTPSPTLNLQPLNKEMNWWPDEIEMTLNY